MSAAPDVAAGWPRPHAACLTDHQRWRDYPPCGGWKDTRPMPWVAEQDDRGWDPHAFDVPRAKAMATDDLCQVCGEPRGATVYALASELPDRAHLKAGDEHYGGALCSLRCARLTAAVCPRYRQVWPVGIYAVDKRDREDLDGTMFDDYDVRGLDPVCVIGDAA